MTEVAASLIWDNDKYMICQRPADKHTHNKTIHKALESLRINGERREYLHSHTIKKMR